MERLGSHVFKSGDKLYNLTTKTELPSNSPMLSNGFFLHGQERAAIEHVLFNSAKTSNIINIKIIPTWRCNLRCEHCFVLHKLENTGNTNLNIPELIAFINRIKSKYDNITNINCCFVGGEPMLNPRLCIDTIMALKSTGMELSASTTTNGTIFNDEVIELLKLLDRINISVDGPEELHNKQRKSKRINPFKETTNNIKKMVRSGFRDKIRVQAAIPDEYWNAETIKNYIKMMLKSGVKFENITYGAITPTKQDKKLKSTFLQAIKSSIRGNPCCKYRCGFDFVIDDNNSIYCDYFEEEHKSRVGSLSDDIDIIEQNMVKMIRESIPALNDEECINCPVVGACWGMCCNISNHVKPSTICNKNWLIETVSEAINNKKIDELFKNQRHIH